MAIKNIEPGHLVDGCCINFHCFPESFNTTKTRLTSLRTDISNKTNRLRHHHYKATLCFYVPYIYKDTKQNQTFARLLIVLQLVSLLTTTFVTTGTVYTFTIKQVTWPAYHTFIDI